MLQGCDLQNLKELKQGTLSVQQRLELLEHMQHCSYCMAAFLDGVEADECPSPPAGFSEQVTGRIAAGRKREFWAYCTKVSVAICASVVLLFSGAFQVDYSQLTGAGMEYIDKTNQKLEHATNYFINMGVMDNEKAE